MSKHVNLEPAAPGKRRRYTPEQKRTLLEEAAKPGQSISEVGRRYGVSPSLLFQWKRAMDDAGDKGLERNERVVPESEVKKLKAKIKELERALGRKTMELEILSEANAILQESAQKKRRTSRGSSSGKDGGR